MSRTLPQAEQDQQMGTAKRCWDLLQSAEYSATKELAQTPLLLTLLCLVFDDSQTFPKNRAVLYGDALDVLLKKWAAEKRIQRDPIYQDLTVKLEEMMLAEIAYTNFSADRLFFSGREVAEQVRAFLSSNVNAPRHLDSEKILEAIQIQQGILVERARDVLSFSHLTLQEYLTAQYIADNDTRDNILIEQVIKERLTDQRWRVVFILVAGLVRGGADELLLRMEAEANKFIATDKLKAFVDWSEQSTKNLEGDYKPAAKRVVAIYCALALALVARARTLSRVRALDLALVLVRALARARDFDLDRALVRAHDLDLDRALDRALAHGLAHDLDRAKLFNSVDFSTLIDQLKVMEAQVPNGGKPLEVRRAFADRLRQTWYDALHLESEWLNFSKEEIDSLENYLYANELMIRCKEAALRVSPQVWNAIEERMLTVRDD